MREGRRLLERHARRHRRERPFRGGDVLGEGALPEREQVPEDLVARPEPGHPRTDALDDAGDIESEAMVPRRPHAR